MDFGTFGPPEVTHYFGDKHTHDSDHTECDSSAIQIVFTYLLTYFNGTPMTELRDVICHMGSHSVAWLPTQVNVQARQADTRFTYPRGMEG